MTVHTLMKKLKRYKNCGKRAEAIALLPSNWHERYTLHLYCTISTQSFKIMLKLTQATASVIAILALVPARAALSQPPSYPFPTVPSSAIHNSGPDCYMQTEQGSVLDLSQLCGKDPSPTSPTSAQNSLPINNSTQPSRPHLRAGASSPRRSNFSGRRLNRSLRQSNPNSSGTTTSN